MCKFTHVHSFENGRKRERKEHLDFSEGIANEKTGTAKKRSNICQFRQFRQFHFMTTLHLLLVVIVGRSTDANVHLQRRTKLVSVDSRHDSTCTATSAPTRLAFFFPKGNTLEERDATRAKRHLP